MSAIKVLRWPEFRWIKNKNGSKDREIFKFNFLPFTCQHREMLQLRPQDTGCFKSESVLLQSAEWILHGVVQPHREGELGTRMCWKKTRSWLGRVFPLRRRLSQGTGSHCRHQLSSGGFLRLPGQSLSPCFSSSPCPSEPPLYRA